MDARHTEMERTDPFAVMVQNELIERLVPDFDFTDPVVRSFRRAEENDLVPVIGNSGNGVGVVQVRDDFLRGVSANRWKDRITFSSVPK